MPRTSHFICYFAPNLGVVCPFVGYIPLFQSDFSMNSIHINQCPLCGCTHSSKAFTCIDHYASGESFAVCVCDACRFMWTQDFPAEAEIGAYYESADYISHTDTRRGVMNTLYHHVRNLMLKRKAGLVERASGQRTGRLLDIGTGTGYFPATMQQRGWKVEAIEKSEQARAFAQTHFGLSVQPDEALMGAFAGERFDVITLWHVMEHLEPLNEVWQRLHQLLADDGVLVVAVPNSASFDAQYYGSAWAAYDVPRHLWHFTRDTMAQWGMKHGFEPVGLHPMPFDAFYVSMLTEKQLKHSAAFLRGMWTGLLAWFSALVKRERSSSLIYVFRKKGKC